jgi:general stress protein YciG
MPRGNYSYSHPDNYESGDRQPYPAAWAETAITEPGQQQGAVRYSQASDEIQAVQTKESGRQGTARRSASPGRRTRMTDYDEEPQPRSRSSRSNRGTTQRRGTASRSVARRGATSERTARSRKSRRGFAAMSSEQQREIARKGGLTVSRNRKHMAEIGRVGGERSHGGRQARGRR